MIENGRDAIVDISYFAAAICFIVGLKFLSQPARARQGNQLAAVGMLVAILATFISRELSENYVLITVGILIGAVVSSYASRQVQMTAMPQMVAIFNGMGGATAALVSLGEFSHKDVGRGEGTTIVLGALIGAISFSGSMVAFGKLQELIAGRPITFPNQKLYNAALFAAAVALCVLAVALGDGTLAKTLVWLLFAVALVLGATLVLPIGGADMPVVIAILNSLTGLAAALTGLALDNQALVIAGALVGASGSYLTVLMGKAMNRSVANVLFGAFGATPVAGPSAATGEALPVRETSAEDAAVQLAYA
ncbi:MAG: NAD(P)(+) transhydrogenase (Re/Si-specific) subunit beta, partial [Thermomicrobiales bacterium]